MVESPSEIHETHTPIQPPWFPRAHHHSGSPKNQKLIAVYLSAHRIWSVIAHTRAMLCRENPSISKGVASPSADDTISTQTKLFLFAPLRHKCLRARVAWAPPPVRPVNSLPIARAAFPRRASYIFSMPCPFTSAKPCPSIFGAHLHDIK
jgi:hypothetical protein